MKDENIDEWWVRSTSETCQFFNVTQKTLSNWEKKGAPKKDHGKWDIKELIEWKYMNGKEESAEVRKLKAEADLKESKAAQEAIKLALTEGRYIQVDKVTRDLKRLFSVLKKSLVAIGHNVATEFYHIKNLQGTKTIQKCFTVHLRFYHIKNLQGTKT